MGNYSSYQTTEPFKLALPQSQAPKDSCLSFSAGSNGRVSCDAKANAKKNRDSTKYKVDQFQYALYNATTEEDKAAIREQKKVADAALTTIDSLIRDINNVDSTVQSLALMFLRARFKVNNDIETTKIKTTYMPHVKVEKNYNNANYLVTKQYNAAEQAFQEYTKADNALNAANKINKDRIAINAAAAAAAAKAAAEKAAAEKAAAAKAAAEKAAAEKAAAEKAAAEKAAAEKAAAEAKAAKKKAADDAYAADGEFMLNAANFSNSKYSDLDAAWTAYTAARAPSITIDTLLAKYVDFIAKKTLYVTEVIQMMNTNRSTDSNYVSSNQSIATALSNRKYMDIASYNDMKDAWNTYNKISLTADNITDLLIKYKSYLDKKADFAAAISRAQGKEGDANFISQLSASKKAANEWINSAPKGCRNIITSASTDQSRLKEAIQCKDTEFLSGYSKVSGYDSAPGYDAVSTDTSINKDNIANYLAYKYSCCTAPIGFAGNKGAAGLPGLNGIDGAKGPKGPKGLQGGMGPVGPAGPKGAQGKKGEQGNPGPDGARGPIGLKGENGKSVKARDIIQLPGPRGPKGAEGPEGPMGLLGSPGKPVVIEVKEPEQTPEEDSILELLALQNKIRHFFYG